MSYNNPANFFDSATSFFMRQELVNILRKEYDLMEEKNRRYSTDLKRDAVLIRKAKEAKAQKAKEAEEASKIVYENKLLDPEVIDHFMNLEATHTLEDHRPKKQHSVRRRWQTRSTIDEDISFSTNKFLGIARQNPEDATFITLFKPVKFRMHVISNKLFNVSVFEKETRGRLFDTKTDTIQKKQVHGFLTEKAVEHILDHPIDQDVAEDVCNFYANRKHDFFMTTLDRLSRKRESAEIYEPWIQRSLKLVPMELGVKHRFIIQKIITDVGELYKASIQKVSTYACIKHLEEDENMPFVLFKPDAPGKRFNQDIFRNVVNLKRRIIYTHRIFRYIVDLKEEMFPDHFMKVEQFRNGKYHRPKTLVASVLNEVKTFDYNVLNRWYQTILAYIQEGPDFFDIPERTIPKMAKLMAQLIKGMALQLIAASVKNATTVLCDPYKTPLIHFNAHFKDGKIYVTPSIRKLFQYYAAIVKQPSCVAEDWANPEFYIVKDVQKKILKIRFVDRFIPNHQKIVIKNLRTLLQPMTFFYDRLAYEFIELSPKHFFNGLYSGQSMKHLFNRLNENLALKKRIRRLTDYEYLGICRVNQTLLKTGLETLVSEQIHCILTELTLMHIEDNCRLQKRIADVRRRCGRAPTTTEELMALGRYMAHSAGSWMVYMESEVLKMLHNVGRIVDYAVITPRHMKHIVQTIRLYHSMPQAFKDFGTLYETTRFEMEEHLQVLTEELNRDLEEFGVTYLEGLNNFDNIFKVSSYAKFILTYVRMIEAFEKRVAFINKEETLFHLANSHYPELQELKDIIFPYAKLILMINKWLRKRKIWLRGPFENLKLNEIEETIEDYLKAFTTIHKTYKGKCKQQAIDQYSKKFAGVVDDQDFNNWPSPLKMTTQALETVKEMKHHLTLIGIMCNPFLTERHWGEMSAITGFDMLPDAGTCLQDFIDYKLDHELNVFEIISVGAVREANLKENFEKMKAEWDNMCFGTLKYKETPLVILASIDDIQALLDDHIVRTLSMRGSAFVKPVEEEVCKWYDLLIRVNKTIEEWGKVQIQWLYLLPIFSSKDIVAQMPEEGLLFQEVDRTYKFVMKQVTIEPHVLPTAGAETLLPMFKSCLEKLETINAGVNCYLEKKRLFFPRFFFLSNDEMLEILSETGDPKKVQPHLRKCFEGINSLEFDEGLNILAMISAEGEKIMLDQPISTVKARGSVEKWLIQLEDQMAESVRTHIFHSYLKYTIRGRTQWVLLWPGQVVLCVSQIYWTSECHACLIRKRPDVLKRYHIGLTKQLNRLIELVRGDLTKQNRITLCALVVLDVHSKDVVNELYRLEIKGVEDFQWLAQMRYYWFMNVFVRLTNANVKYAYEYLGNTDRLVITPLTDRCYRTLIGAYNLNLNGAPEGPAGTGKTETTKDLAKAIAVQCVVFNCSDGLDYIAMGKFFKGLASSGAWSCFDEFNRIDIEVLSVIAQQILSIIQAIRNKLERFDFEGTNLKLNPNCYVCITMNPGYAGRSELPDNLKVLFRTVAMMVPDYALIGEISLYSYGFLTARELSVKIVTTYRLCSEQLSSQCHYDYGMRAVKTVLSAAGKLKLRYHDEEEDILVLRSIIDVNLPKFLSQDIPLFNGIISDLFPGLALPEPKYDQLHEAMKEVCTIQNLQPHRYFLTKLTQTYEMMLVRHGFMLVGDPFGGKTCTLKVLSDTLTLMNQKQLGEEAACYVTINPKAVTIGQLYGSFDAVSHEWSDGVIATAFREYAVNTSQEKKWIVFDGPVDAVWIENMNTVLDDNKKLCLNSGEVIQMTPVMSMVFEVMDLSQASPATVSRCGMIYFEPKSLGWKPLMESWMNTLPKPWIKDKPERIPILCNWLFPSSLKFVKKHKRLGDAGIANQVWSAMKIIEMLIKEAFLTQFESTKYIVSCVQAAFTIGVTWGIGGTLESSAMELFDAFCKRMWRGEHKDYPYPDKMDPIEVHIPNEGLIIDYHYSFQGKGQWKYLPDNLRNVKPDEKDNLQTLLVPTVETLRYLELMELHCRHKAQFLTVGPTGTGKSFLTQNLLMNRLSLLLYTPGFITFTASTTANGVQELVLSKLVKKRRGLYGSTQGKVVVLFIDDLNMPVKEQYGAQPPLELLRQYFDHGHWYDLKDTSKIHLSSFFIIAAMGLPGGSRQHIYKRFLRHFTLYAMNTFTNETLTKIFLTILTIGFRRIGFASDSAQVGQQIVAATLALYDEASAQLLPTPAKSHYVFNLRDIGRVIHGTLLVKKDSVDSKKVFVRLWVHEVLRVFYDRLLDSNDRKWFCECIVRKIDKEFREKYVMMLDGLNDNPQDKRVTEESLRNLMFSSVFDKDAAEEDKKYEEIPSLEKFYEVANAALDEYNATHKTNMNIVLFRYALEHLSRVCRILAIAGGCGLLVGVGGSGRQSLVRLGAYLSDQSVFQPEISRAYGLNEWREDIKKVLKEAGGKGKNMVFLFSEGQIKFDYFLQDIDALLNSGEVPNLFAVDEKQEILEMTRLAAQGGNRNLDVSPLAVFAFFISRCKHNLHIMLCFSPIGSAFRNRLRLFPSLVNCCTIDWYEGWPEDALERVAQVFLANIPLEPAVKHATVMVCKYFHVSARVLAEKFYAALGKIVYVTSASFLDLIRAYTQLVLTKQTELYEAKMRYLGGLDKLDFAAAQVTVMQKDLELLQPKLKQLVEETNQMLAGVEKEKIIVDKASAQVREDEKVANEQADASNAIKMECENDLASAIPILEDALAALNTLKNADITLVKSMKNPPEVVKLVMAGVCVMKDIKPDRVPDPNNPGRKMLDYWGPSKRMLGDMGFLQSLKEFDKDNIPSHIMQTIRKQYIPNPDFVPSNVAKASSAAEGMCKWILALDKYDVVVKMVAPKKAKLAIAEKQFAKTQALLNAKREELATLEKRLANLNQKLDTAVQEKKRLQNEVKMCSNKLEKAKQIIGNLGGEKERWFKAAQELHELFFCVPGDVLISCGVIAYLAPFTQSFRNSQIEEWKDMCKQADIPTSNEFSLIKNLGTEIKIHAWTIYGLPADSFSIENAIIMDSSKKWPLFIDPQGQANKWVKLMEKENELEIIKLTESNYMKILESCLEYGKPLLLENILEDIDAPMDPVLLKNTFKQGGQEYISLGENAVQYHRNFRLYITTKLRNPHYLPEVFNKVTLINFALTFEGLADQLLGIVVAKERPDLQEKREHLIVQSATNRIALQKTEDDILKTLSSVKGNILEDETAVQMLERSKELAVDILQKQEAAKDTQDTIEKFRLQYKPIADYSSNLYYSITELPNVDPMYQYSLNWFINIYVISVETAGKSKLIDVRLKFLKEMFLYTLYMNVCRSLFDKDKLLYSFIICTSLMLFEGTLQRRELDFLITGGIGLENEIPNPAKEWLSNKSWDELCRLKDLPDYEEILNTFEKYQNQWKEYYDLALPTFDDLPPIWSESLSDFKKLVLFRIFRPDRVPELVVDFVKEQIGVQYVQPPGFDLAKSYKDSNFSSPLIFILSAGVDPMQALMAFAQKMEFQEKFQSISLGQGQGPRAEELIKNAQAKGHWVCLQNCHLCVSWLPTLEKICEDFDADNTSEHFRLWLTSYPSNKFPESILQNGVKMTNEAPTGLQQNLARTYRSEPLSLPEFYESCPGKDEIFAKMLFGLSFFHAVVLERKKFGALGWNIQYGFNESDFSISVEQLKMYLQEFEEIPYPAVTYLTGECNYGGRVTDNWDRRTLNTILGEYVNPNIIFVPEHQLCPTDNRYIVPHNYGYNDFVEYIKTLPTVQSPEIYGLHANAGITRNLNDFKILMDSMVLISGKHMGQADEKTDVLSAIINDILQKLPKEFDVEAAIKKYPVDYKESMNTVLVQEMERFNKLTGIVKSSLQQLNLAIKGRIVMTPDLEALASSLILSHIPSVWISVSYPSLKPLGSYINDLVERLNFFKKWNEKGKPSEYWMSGFFFTQGFLTGAMQNFARRYVISIDQLAFDFEVIQETPEEYPQVGVVVHGLFLDGARWDKERHLLEEQFPKILSDELPLLWIKPCHRLELDAANRYDCPLYKTSERKGVLSTTGHSTNYVISVLLDTEKEPKHWIMRGLALLCQIDL